MEKIQGWENVEVSSGGTRMPAGGYVCTIVNAEYTPLDKSTNKGNYLTLEVDVTEGEFTDHASNNFRDNGWWNLTFCVSAKDSVAWKFKKFTNAVEGSNNGYEWDWDESKLVGKDVGIVMNEEEYVKNNGDIGVRFGRWDAEFCTADDIRNGKFKLKDLKKLAHDPVTEVDTREKALADNPFA